MWIKNNGWMILALMLISSCTAYQEPHEDHEITEHQSPGSLLSYQSNMNMLGEDYGSGFTYNPTTKSFIMTGSSYVDGKSSCFLCRMDKTPDGKLDMKWYRTFESDTLAACSGLAYLTGTDEDHMALIGYIEKSSKVQERNGTFLLEDLSDGWEYSNTVNGFLLDVNINGDTSDDLISGRLMKQNAVQYPIIVQNHPTDTDTVYVASLVSSDETRNMDYEFQEALTTGKSHTPNPNGGVFKYGSSFEVELQEYTYQPEAKEFRNGWNKIFATMDSKDVRIHDFALTANGDRLVYVGSTSGHGKEFGDSDWTSAQDLDGFVTQLDTTRGVLVNGVVASKRIQSNPGEDEILEGVCSDGHFLYIVGSTTGTLDPDFAKSAMYSDQHDRFSAFIMKLDADTLDAVWVRQLSTVPSETHAPQDVKGIGCTVKTSQVYLTGIVADNGNVIKEGLGYGQDDIFVASYDVDSGERKWIRQIGTPYNDVVPAGHSGILVDEIGNVVVMGSTRGSMYRVKKSNEKQSTDYFIISLNKNDGSSLPLVDVPPGTSTKQGLTPPSSTLSSLEEKTGDQSSSMPYAHRMGISVLISLALITLFLLAYWGGVRRASRKYQRHAEDDHAEVTRYLEELESKNQNQNQSTLSRMFNRSSNTQEEHPPEIQLKGGERVPPPPQFDIGTLGVADDFMGPSHMAHDADSVGDIQKPEGDANGSAYDELLEGLHSIQGLGPEEEKEEEFVLNTPEYPATPINEDVDEYEEKNPFDDKEII